MKRRSHSIIIATILLALLTSFTSACIFGQTDDEGPTLPGPSQLRELVREISGVISLSASFDGSKLLYITVPYQGEETSYLVVRDARIGRALQLIEDEPVRAASWGPDSSTVLYLTYEEDERKATVNVMAEDDLAPESILTFISHDTVSSPAWSPDGRFVAVWSRKKSDEATSESTLWMLRPDGSDLTTLYGGAKSKTIGDITGNIAWFPDSSKLLFSMSKGNATNAFVLERRSGDLRNLTSNHLKVSDLVLSPSGKKIGYAAVEGDDPNGLPRVWVMNADGSGKQALGPQGRPVGWIPNSRELVYIAPERGKNGSRLEAIDLRTKSVRILGEEVDAKIVSATVSNDSRVFYATADQNGDGRIMVVE